MDVLPEGAVVGGGPANTAKALARLGRSVEFIGGISTDHYGDQIARQLRHEGVDLRHSHFSDKPTATAKVTLDEKGSASYLFTTDDTATFDFSEDWLPDPFACGRAATNLERRIELIPAVRQALEQGAVIDVVACHFIA